MCYQLHHRVTYFCTLYANSNLSRGPYCNSTRFGFAGGLSQPRRDTADPNYFVARGSSFVFRATETEIRATSSTTPCGKAQFQQYTLLPKTKQHFFAYFFRPQNRIINNNIAGRLLVTGTATNTLFRLIFRPRPKNRVTFLI